MVVIAEHPVSQCSDILGLWVSLFDANRATLTRRDTCMHRGNAYVAPPRVWTIALYICRPDLAKLGRAHALNRKIDVPDMTGAIREVGIGESERWAAEEQQQRESFNTVRRRQLGRIRHAETYHEPAVGPNLNARTMQHASSASCRESSALGPKPINVKF
ncbi:hypothetical protein R5H32_16540 [Defluviimonas sp. D31]|nr:hypothetical protein [Defluviimonas sp. D31]MDW4550971.1 hypothetical protein [Defluviimonas sp. D31]